MSNVIYTLYQGLTRKKVYDAETVQASELKRCLSIFDLTTLGIGSTLGAGTYILTGQVAYMTAGPSVVVSFLIAAVASILAGLCYAEFGARAPRAGSAYTYTYVSIGELMAFVIGWNMILEYVIGAASTARALSTYFDSLINFSMRRYFVAHLSFRSGAYADPFALAVCLFITVLLVVGIKESAVLNNLLTAANLVVVVAVVVIGVTKVDWHNWNITPEEAHNMTNVTESIGKGGFFPFGVEGALAGAATCFYAFVGFDLVATAGEETKNPQRAIPISICLTLIICTIVYCAVAVILTLMVPYFFIDPDAALPEAFRYANLPTFKYIIGVGALSGIFSSLIGSLLPLPRVLYAIASDGLIFRFVAWIHPRLQTPVIATVLGGVGSGIMALVFDLNTLVEMMSIGTLLAYSLVSISVLYLRYQPTAGATESLDEETRQPMYSRLLRPEASEPTSSSETIARVLIYCIVINSFILCAIHIFAVRHLLNKEPLPLACFFISITVEVGLALLLSRQPSKSNALYFETPLVPYVPICSVLINVYLILKLSPATWVRFGVWMTAGFLIYGCYGFRNSSQRQDSDRQPLLGDRRASSENS